MSIEQIIIVEGFESYVRHIPPNYTSVIQSLRVTQGLEGNLINADYYMEVEIYCDPKDQFGSVTYLDPISNTRKSFSIYDDEKVELGIRLDEAGTGTITWRHVPGDPEKGVIYRGK